MIGVVAGAVLLAAFGAPGVAALRRLPFGLTPVEQVAFGAPAGMVAASLALLVTAILLGFGQGLVTATAVVCVVAAALLWRGGRRGDAFGFVAVAPEATLRFPFAVMAEALKMMRAHRLATLVIGGFAIWWAVLWYGALVWDEGSLFAMGPLWGDWAQHVGDVTSFAYGDNFPPELPRYAGHAYGYHFLPSLTAAAMVEVGTSPTAALTFHSWALSVFGALGIYAFARRLTRDSGAAALTVLLFLLGGGMGWLLFVQEANEQHSFWRVLSDTPWENAAQQRAHFVWQNVYVVSLAPQRGYLYGLPLVLLTLTLLLRGVQDQERRLFIGAGIAAGLLPFAHLGPLPALGLIAGTLFLVFPSRLWFAFFGIWLGLTLPQLFLQQGGEQGTLSGMRWMVGWMSDTDPWWWFWLKNLGWFVPLLVAAAWDRVALGSVARRFLWAFTPIFIISNLVVLQPDPWDNVKLLNYWFLAICVMAAAVLARAWREQSIPAVRFLVLAVVGMMVFSGVLMNIQAKQELPLWLTPEEVALAEQVREVTPRDAVFAVGLQPNHPVPMLSGRLVVMSYTGWMWPRGIDTFPIERDLLDIYRYTPNAPELLKKHNVDYVVIGPWERSRFNADETAYRTQFPIVARTATYEVFDVRSVSEG